MKGKKKRWKEATCKKCFFRVSDYCRRLPPSVRRGSYGISLAEYPIVTKKDEDKIYEDACAEFKELK